MLGRFGKQRVRSSTTGLRMWLLPSPSGALPAAGPRRTTRSSCWAASGGQLRLLLVAEAALCFSLLANCIMITIIGLMQHFAPQPPCMLFASTVAWQIAETAAAEVSEFCTASGDGLSVQWPDTGLGLVAGMRCARMSGCTWVRSCRWLPWRRSSPKSGTWSGMAAPAVPRSARRPWWFRRGRRGSRLDHQRGYVSGTSSGRQARRLDKQQLMWFRQ